MKNLVILLTAAGIFAFCSNSQAQITDAWWDTPASGGPIWCTTQNYTGGILYWTGGQNAAASLTGRADLTGDPTLTLTTTVNNATSFAWNSYQVQVILGGSFSFVPPGPSVTTPSDWTVTSATVAAGSGPYAGDYVGTLDLTAGTSIAIGDDLDFVYSINFANFSDTIEFTQIMTPSSVPEPSVLALLPMGGMLLAMLRRNGRKSA